MDHVGRYGIVEELGRGAMGVVYKALDPAIGRTVAIKSIRLSDFVNGDERRRVRERLLREAQAAGLLSHPNIITIYDVLEENDFAHIFMEYVNGSSLADMMARQTLPGRDELLLIFRQVADALDYAHRKGIVHRDIKPANIIVAHPSLANEGSGSETVAKIADFGVAKVISQEMTHTGTMIGTPSYMSPEQIQGLVVDGKSDQFSLAVIIYEILAGEKPFAAEALPTLFYQIVKQDPKPVEEVNPQLSETVGKVMHRALAKEPGERFSSCSDFIGALTIALGDCTEWTPVTNVNAAAVAEERQVQARAAHVGGARQALVGSEAPQAVEVLPVVVRSRAPAADAPSPEIEEPAISEPAEEETVSLAREEPVVASPAEPVDLWPGATRRRRHEPETEEPEGRPTHNRGTQKLALFVALLFAVAAAIVFIVRSNSGPSVPVEVLDDSKTPASAPPESAAQTPLERQQAGEAARQGSAERARPAQVHSPAPVNQNEQPSPTAAPPATNEVADVEFVTDPPGAKVTIDNRSDLACTAPCTLSLSNGRHTMATEMSGYGVARRIFNVPSDGNLFVNLNKEMGVLVLTSIPNGSEILIDGKSYGKTPATLHLAVGEHRVVLRNGSMDHEETVNITPDGFDARSFRWQ